MDEQKEYYRYGQSLSHHGINGQKWGRRRFQNPDGSLTAAGRDRYGVESVRSTPAIVGKSTRKVEAAVAAKAGVAAGRMDAKAGAAAGRMDAKAGEAAGRVEKKVYGAAGAASGYVSKNGPKPWDEYDAQKAKAEEAAKIQNDKNKSKSEEQKKDSGGQSKPQETTMIPKYSKDGAGMNDTQLANVIKRQKLQNQYNDLMDPEKKFKKEYKEEWSNRKSKLDSTKSIFNATASATDSVSRLVRTLPRDQKIIKAKKIDLSGYSNQQLQEMITRANLERQWNQTFNPDKVKVNKGREKTIQMLETGAAVLNVAGSAVGIASAVADLRSKRLD